MTNGWTDERRKKQAEAIRRHKPWEKATGPKSEAGKKRSSQNAFKHGFYAQEMVIVKDILKKNKEFLDLYAQFCGLQNLREALERTHGLFNEINGDAPRSPENRGTK